MQTFDLLASLPRAERGLGAHRWGMPPTTARVLAAMLLEPENAARVVRRGIDAGAPQLCRLLVEHGGSTVPYTDALALEYARLSGWFPVLASPEGWAVPRDFSAAAAASADQERFFTATLLSRVPAESLKSLYEELGLTAHGTQGYKFRTAVETVATAPKDARLAQHAQNVADLQAIRVRDIDSVDLIPGFGGLAVRFVLADGEEIEICPREQAELHGEEFAAVKITTVANVGSEHEMPAVRVPAVQEIGALITFATARAAEECAAHSEFRSVVARRVGDTTIATRPSCTAEQAHETLLRLGFHIDAPAETT